MQEICYFDSGDSPLFATEFAHSTVGERRIIGPRIREDHLLHIVVKGVCRFSDFDVPAGSMLLICGGVRHHFAVDAGYEHYWIGFGGTQVPAFLARFGLSPGRHVRLPAGNAEFVQSLLALSLRSCLQHPQEQIALGALETCLRLAAPGGASPAPDDISRAARFMQNNYHRKFSMQQLAAHVRLSEKHLCRKFVRRFGVSPRQYLLDLRMQKARILLRETPLKIKEIADSVGYASQLTFSDMYKKHFGVPPSADRRQEP